MDNYNVEVYLDVKKLDERKEEETSNIILSSSGFRIHRLNLYFKCKTEILITRSTKDGGIYCRGTLPLMVNSFQFDYDQQQVMPYAKTYSTIRREFKVDWPHIFRDKLIARIMWRIWDMVESVSHSNNVLDIGVEVVVKYHGTYRRSTKMVPHSNLHALYEMDIENARTASEKSDTADDEDEDCPICLEGLFGYGRAAIYLKCLHAFHASCLVKWVGEKVTCPTCRHKVLRIPMRIKISPQG